MEGGFVQTPAAPFRAWKNPSNTVKHCAHTIIVSPFRWLVVVVFGLAMHGLDLSRASAQFAVFACSLGFLAAFGLSAEFPAQRTESIDHSLLVGAELG